MAQDHGWANAVRWLPPAIYQLRYEDDTYHDARKETIPEAVLDQAQKYPWTWVRFTCEAELVENDGDILCTEPVGGPLSRAFGLS